MSFNVFHAAVSVIFGRKYETDMILCGLMHLYRAKRRMGNRNLLKYDII